MENNKTLNSVFTRLLTIKLILPSVVLALLLLVTSSILNVANIQQSQDQVVRSIAQNIDSYIQNARQTLATIAQFTELRSSPVELEQIMDATLETHQYFETLYVLDPQRIIVAITPANKRYLQLDMSNQPFVKPPVNSNYSVSTPFVSPETGTLTVVMTFYLPNNYIVVGHLSLATLQQTIAGAAYYSEGRDIVITDQHTSVLAHNKNVDWVTQQTSLRLLGEIPGEQIFGFGVIRSSQNGWVFENSAKLSESAWVVTATTPVATALQSYLITNLSILFVILVLWVSVIISIRNGFAVQIVTPLNSLKQQVHSFATDEATRPLGNPKHKDTFSELRALLASFEQMRQTINTRQAAISESEYRYRTLIDQSNDSIYLEVNGSFELVNQTMANTFNLISRPDDRYDSGLLTIVTPDAVDFIKSQHKRLLSGEIKSTRMDFTAINRDGQQIEVEDVCTVFPYRGQMGIQGIIRDITDRKRAEQSEHEQRVLAEALRDTASALNSTLNSDAVLNLILENVGKVITYDSSVIMLLDEDDKTARVAASKGYTERGLGSWLGALKLSVEHTPNLKKMYATGEALVIPDTFIFPEWVQYKEANWIRSYAGAPIKIKNRVIGFLNMDCARANFYTQQMAGSLQAFADQAGLALHNARLLEDLQKSHLELRDAYETTLLGWSKALELRDYETQGHTMRVSRMTEELASAMGIPEEEMTNIRYGVLLHDIGKILIPDTILFKAGPLSEDEWKIMRMHPIYAYQIISPIPYLAQALNIPYCHHERWDGSGYPRSLKGLDIPLSARIFAVVDVWDGLRSKRPYHSPWPVNQVIEYIRQQAGKSLDPQVVSAFLTMLADDMIAITSEEDNEENHDFQRHN